MVTLIQLEYVIAVDTYRHFATAAQKCFVTQPTLSMQIKKLEEQLGVIIFDRSRHPVIPTDIGSKVIDQARLILRDTEKINEIINSFQEKITGELKIGIIPTLAPYLLPKFIGNVVRKYPGINIQIEEIITEDIVKKLKTDLLDVGILVTPLKDADITESPLFYEEIKIYANQDHGFSQNDGINLNEIASPDLWMLHEGHCFRSQVINLCSNINSTENNLPFQYESGSLETLKKMVDTEGGFTLLPELAFNGQNDNIYSRIKHFKNFKPLREVSLVTVRNYAKSNILNILSDEISKVLPKEMYDKKRGIVIEWR
ncbi:hydrogen peroxide-inducible genes activator [Flexithrix dorotheae]|uniref:hydrogen peroxide-inducible genes activator n=1 Tax=Flexithrix dorotheae TaxID=70993 RepID=UPI00037AB7A9|nr:hydrogen peroxide-inducible genes activator [Flexithrix dorotheae]